MKFLLKFGDRITELMQERGLKPTSLAKEIGVVRSAVNDFCAGRQVPTYQTLIKLVNYFDCSADYLLGLVEYPPEEKLYDVLPFGDRLLFCLKTFGKTQTSLHKDLKISTSVLYYWTHNVHLPQVYSLVDVANYLECSVDFLIGRRR